MNITVNYLAVLLAAIASMVVGFIWYGPLFGKTWSKLKGFTKEDMEKGKKDVNKLYALTFVMALLEEYILSHVMQLSMAFFHTSPISTGLTTGFWMWAGFVVPVMVSLTIFGHKKLKLLSIDAGHQLATLLVMGIVLGLIS